MNEIYHSDTMCVHDDREFITDTEAFAILSAGGSIDICDPPDFSAENEHDIYSMPWTITMNDIPEEYRSKSQISEYLRSYELSR